MDGYPLTTSLVDAAHEIQKNGFALYMSPPETRLVLEQAWREAVQILQDDSTVRPKAWTRIVGGHLHGYNEPSQAKRLFRAFCASSDQPWPNEKLKNISCAVSEHLHQILLECYGHIRQSQKRVKARCLEGESRKSSFSLHNEFEGASIRASQGIDRLKKRRRTTQDLVISPTANDTRICPLDYFYYHNQQLPGATNCTEHIDRGVLIAICLTDVPGLEILVQSQGNDCWICPERIDHNERLYAEARECSLSGWICIMAGGQLADEFKDENIRPCIHRVRNRLKRARMSISYELRAESC